MTFGFQSTRMDANEQERTYGSLATFAFSNSQTAGFNAAGTLNADDRNPVRELPLGDLNATTVIEDSVVATRAASTTYAFWAQDDFKVSPKLSLNLGLRYDIMNPYTEVEDRWSFMNPDLPNPAVGGYPGAMQFAGSARAAASAGRRSTPTTARSVHGSARPSVSASARCCAAATG